VNGPTAWPDHAAAAELATEAGELLLALRPRASGEELKARGDRESHELLMRRLAERYPDDAVLSEEGADDPARLRASRVWIVDPLDGTREYGEPQRRDWAVHVALWQEGDLVAGAVALPAVGVTLRSDPPEPIPAPKEGRPRIAVSRSRPPAFAEALADALDAELVPLGSAGYKAAALLLGEVDIYAHAGGQWEWDSAAPVAVARAAGLYTARLDGSPLVYNQPHPYLPDLLLCRPEAQEDVAAALKWLGEDGGAQ
jgi:3'(2'), 5'-bisphosphate nucleotidase